MQTRRRYRLTGLDLGLVGAVAAVVTYLVWRAEAVVKYRWNWGLVAPYIIRYDETQHRWVANLLLQGLLETIRIAIWAGLTGLTAVAASYGMLVVVFKWGVGHTLFGLYTFGQIEGWIPIFLFAMLFGLSMDYEVFLVTRMREAWDRGEDNVTAVASGLERTGRIITAAAIIMCAAFSGFIAGRIVGLQEFGIGLAVAIFVDATIVRSLLVPSLMAVFGRWNWWLPPPFAHAVRVQPSPLGEHGA